MSELRQREDEIRSKAIRDSARGTLCMLNFPCCNYDPETSVWCHWRDESFGRSRKAHDCSGFVGCSACHAWLDVGWAGKMSLALIRFYVIRAMQRAFVHLIRTHVVTVKLEEPTHRERPAKPRKSTGRSIPRGPPLKGRSNWPEGRKIANRKSGSLI